MMLETLDTLISFVAILTGVSLLVTTLTQSVSAVVNLRGKNLHWGIKELITNVDPALKQHAPVIAEKILQHPLISDSTLSNRTGALFSRWKYSSAIRYDELVKIVRLLAHPGDADRTGAEPWRVALRSSLDRLLPAEAEKLLVVLPEIKKLFPDDPSRVELVMAQLIPTAERLTADVGDWFNTVMDRVSQRFVVHTRVWTVMFSVIVAFLLQLDAFSLYRSLSSNAELRARALASVEAIERKADELLVTAPTGEVPSGVFVLAMKQLIAAHPELQTLPEPSGFSTLDGARAWLTEKLAAIPVPEPERWLGAYDAQVPQSSLRLAADNLNSALKSQSLFQLPPNPYPDPIYRNWIPTERPFWGILASAALLSLGAPFWFNLLKNMSSLRPIVAAKEKHERTASVVKVTE
jgi:hypothetical protein